MSTNQNPPRLPTTGTDFRDDELKCYVWPHPFWQRPGDVVEQFPAVSSVLESLESFGKVREVWQSKHTVELGKLANMSGLQCMVSILRSVLIDKKPLNADWRSALLEVINSQRTYSRWNHEQNCMVEVNPLELLLDRQWIEGAGWRELNRVAARGTVVHDAIEEWVYKFVGGGQMIDYDDERQVWQYTLDIIEDERRRRGKFYVEPEACWKHVQQALRWLDMHVKAVHMAETAVFNRTVGYAGTVDLDVELKNAEGIWRIDAKTSSKHYDSHRIQLSAYYYAEFAAIMNANSLEPLTKPDHTANLYIGTEGAILREWWTDKKGKVIPEERDKDFAAFSSLLLLTMPRVKPVLGEDGKRHAINPRTIEKCTNRPPRADKEQIDDE